MTEPESETLRRYIEKLGQENGEYLHHLEQTAIWLVSVWDTYRSFFGTNPERVDLLNQASGFVTGQIQDALYEQIILGLCRITDPPETGRFRNVTVRGLVSIGTDTEISEELSNLIDVAVRSTDFARRLRDKVFAHTDLDVQRNGSLQFGLSREQIVQAINSIIRPLRLVHEYHFESRQYYHAVKPLPDDVGFLTCVHYGVAERDRMRRGRRSLPLKPDKPLPDWLVSPLQNEFDLPISSRANNGRR